MFDAFLRRRAERLGKAFRPFEIATDYLEYVDGKPRYDGVRSFLCSRGIELPEGSPDSPSDEESICGLGNRKSEMVLEVLATEGVEPYEGSVRLLHRLREHGFAMAVVTSSRNCDDVLRAAGLEDWFAVRIDGDVAVERRLAGKPAPDTFLAAADALGVARERAVVVEDAMSGVQAGRAGKFGLVIGVDRHDEAAALAANGADVVVADLGELVDVVSGATQTEKTR